MATTVYDRAQVRALAFGYLQAAYLGKPIGPSSFLGQQAEALSDLVGSIQQAIEIADRDGVPAYDTASAVLRSRCSSEALDNWAVTFGLPSNLGAGRFGRNGPQTATGGGGLVTGAPGTIVPAGALLVPDASGTVQIELVAGVTVPAGGSIAGTFQATSAGAKGNLAAGTVLQFISPVPGLFPFVTLTTGLTGGYDRESDLALLERLLRHLRDPPKGGTAHDYREWAESSTDATGALLGVGRAYVMTRRAGLGTEDIVITVAGGSGKGRGDAGVAGMAARRTAVQAYIDAIRPVNDGPTVILPYFNPARGLSIVVQADPSSEYPWDWRMTGGVATVAGSTPTVVRVTTATVPPQLAQALADGRQPRIQLVLPESPLPQVVRVISSAVAGADTLFTVATALTSAPAAGTIVWPAGGAVLPTAIAVLAYIDQIGPSKQSGFYDSITDSWEALVSIGKIAWAALDAEDATGKKVLVFSPSVGLGVGVKVAVGAGALAADDVLLFDNFPADGPELPWTVSILVIPTQ